MKFSFKTAALVTALAIGTGLPSIADPLDTATPSQYRVTVERVSLCTAANINAGTCTGQFDLVAAGTALDIASSAAGAAVGTLVGAAPTPTPGTYTHLQIQIARAITITGTVIDDDTPGNPPCHTDGNGNAAATGGFANLVSGDTGPAFTAVSQNLNIPAVNDVGGANPSAAAYNAAGMVAVGGADASVTVTFALPGPIIVAAGSLTPTIRINFDVTNALTGGYVSAAPLECVLYPGVPGVNVVITP